MPEHCKKYNDTADKIMGKSGWTMKAQTEQDELAPTRAWFPWADVDLDVGKAPTPTQRGKK
jgi:hypothetical protein